MTAITEAALLTVKVLSWLNLIGGALAALMMFADGQASAWVALGWMAAGVSGWAVLTLIASIHETLNKALS